jgi:integrase
MAKKLTALKVENAKPSDQRQEISDGGSGLYLVVQPSGRKSWAVRYRHAGQTRKLTLDGFVPLAEARVIAHTALAEVRNGRDPATLKFDAKAAAEKAAAERAGDTIERWAGQYLERYARKETRPNSWKMTEHIFDDVIFPAWRGRSIHEIRRKDIIRLVDNVAEDRPVLANRVVATISKFYNWLASKDEIAASPCAGVKAPTKEVPRDRVLEDPEIRALWKASDAIGGQAGAFVKMLLLTGQRRNEVAGIRWSEIAGDLWELPAARTKNKQTHTVPLSRQAMAILDSVPRIADTDYVFGGSPRGNHIGGFSRIKAALDAQMKPAKGWTLHDLRRTCATGLQKLGIRVEVTEAALNHRGGTVRGVAAIYQRHDYAAEKRLALQAWADHVDAIVSGEPVDKVVRGRFGRA